MIGDAGRGVFVRPGIPEFIKERMLATADTLTPNQFELGYLAGRSMASAADLAAAIDSVHERGPRVVFVTSLALDDTPDDAVDLVVSDGSGRWRLRLPRLPVAANGAGDAIAALFFAHHLRTHAAARAMSLAASSVFGVLARTAAAGAGEMLLVDAQEELVAPSRVFDAHPL